MRTLLLAPAVVGLLIASPAHAEVQYPLVLTLDAQFTRGVTTITSKVTIRVERPMLDSARTRVTDALKFGGYANFVTTLRTVAAAGTIATPSAKVEIRYTREEPSGTGSRLVLVADRPLIFLGDPSKAKAGFELTIVDLLIDDRGGITGTLAGAARVRPSGDGGVLLDTYAEEPVQLKGTR